MNNYNIALLCRLIDCQNITPEERRYIMNALTESEDNKKRVGFWISHGSENYETYVCSNCGNMLIPEMLHESEPTFEPCKYKKIYIQAYRYCYICGYKMAGVRNYTHIKDWSVKFDD